MRADPFPQQQESRQQYPLDNAILVAVFVIVAFAFVVSVLSDGTGRPQDSAALPGTLPVLIVSESPQITADGVTLAIRLPDHMAVLDLSIGAGAILIEYTDSVQHSTALPWTYHFTGDHDGDDLLEAGETAVLTLDTAALLNPPNTQSTFMLEIKPPTGAVITTRGGM